MIGYWDWDWGSGSKGPPGANTQVGFTGLIDVNQCLMYSPQPKAGMNNLLSVGGGNAGGMWSAAALNSVSNKTWHGEVLKAGYQGIAFDIEVCSGVVPPSAFTAAFAAIKASNLTIMVSVSHTAPYDCTNKVDLMTAFIPDSNIDYMSPQLYSSGTESAPSFDWDGVPFTAFQKMPPTMKMVPSIVTYTQYPAVQSFFANLSIPLYGYVQWQQVASQKVRQVKAKQPTTIGYWAWTWGNGDKGPQNANLAISFSGWANLDNALDESRPVDGQPTLISIGGGNRHGKWTNDVLQSINVTFLSKVQAAGYTGVAFDVEECEGVIHPTMFTSTFARVKAAGLKVLVTISHSAPYGCLNKVELMHAFIADTNVDYLSPQLYTSGTEQHPDFTAVHVPWTAYEKMPPSMQFVPSIVVDSQYPEVVSYYANLSVPLTGFVQWEQVAPVEDLTEGDDLTVAFWAWSWGEGDHGPPGSNLAISFSGWADLSNALSQSVVYKGLPTMMSIGGGNKNGRWSSDILQQINATFLQKVVTAGFMGIAFDVEECTGVIPPGDFTQTFERVKAAGLKVMVTSSHSAPYGCSNKVDLMTAFIPDSNIDYMSPQLYNSGTEPHPNFTAVDVPWTAYKNMPATMKFVPSIGQFAEYDEVTQYYSQPSLQIPCSGYVQWQQNTSMTH
eukprot:TRINITY_DN226_c0_g1_i1.p1 TRINITY_DN226_c0_g1~~TRINITY_DN226_c0_g1_i1.p1  ORF type:complete len:702 (+),score=243.62 TRINITY_DN226_c0_g1_i1:102-2108(+)